MADISVIASERFLNQKSFHVFEALNACREHLVRCRSCFGRAKFEETLVQLLEARCRRVTCPDALRERIRSLLRAEAERS